MLVIAFSSSSFTINNVVKHFENNSLAKYFKDNSLAKHLDRNIKIFISIIKVIMDTVIIY